MSATILEPPGRVFKLPSEGLNKIAPNNIPQKGPSLKTIYNIPTGKRFDSNHSEASSVFPSFIITNTNRNIMSEAVGTVVRAIRDPIADIQEKRGISKTESYSFVDLLTALFQHSYVAVMCIITMIVGLLPLMEGLLILVRFSLDKILEINETGNTSEKVFKTVVFIGELIVMCSLVALILTVILLPVFQLIRYCILRVFAIVHN